MLSLIWPVHHQVVVGESNSASRRRLATLRDGYATSGLETRTPAGDCSRESWTMCESTIRLWRVRDGTTISHANTFNDKWNSYHCIKYKVSKTSWSKKAKPCTVIGGVVELLAEVLFCYFMPCLIEKSNYFVLIWRPVIVVATSQK